MKTDQSLPIKNIHSNNSSGKPLPINSNDTNHLIILVIDRQIIENHGVSHKIDIVDQIVESISIETTIHDQIQTDQKILLIPVLTQTLGIDTIQ